MTNDPSDQPIQNPKRSPLTSWAFVAALLGAGAVPCPDCGMPLAWHLWPLAMLVIAVKVIAHRARARQKGKPPTEPATMLPERKEP
jgi:hypothetical protein